ncbi:MAG: HNH endonuclease [Parcubacteria group bacterium GW2011_GWF2_38_76]|nr:MAG: HNH endonuclease [Parcubacteria group bacterium GW2011_GWF2_38_76]HBM46136.1 hypothetical protein [Patescibacteria group bacterium]
MKDKKQKSYIDKALDLFRSKLGKIVRSEELAQLTGTSGKPISHNIRRIFELRDELGYNIVNHKDNDKTGLNLKVDEWVLLDKDPDPKKIRSRGVNKKIMFEVFSRDNFTCQTCGRTIEDDDPFKSGHKIKLHVGHKIAHKRKEGEATDKILTKDDFITMCNVCNEGAKNNDLISITLFDRVKDTDEQTQRNIYDFLKKKFI